MLDTPASCRCVQSVCDRESTHCVLILTDGLRRCGVAWCTDAPNCQVDRARSLRAVLYIHLSIFYQQLAESMFLGASHLQRCCTQWPHATLTVCVCVRAPRVCALCDVRASCGAWLSDAGPVRRRVRGNHCLQAGCPRPRADDTQGLHRDVGCPEGLPQEGDWCGARSKVAPIDSSS